MPKIPITFDGTIEQGRQDRTSGVGVLVRMLLHDSQRLTSEMS